MHQKKVGALLIGRLYRGSPLLQGMPLFPKQSAGLFGKFTLCRAPFVSEISPSAEDDQGAALDLQALKGLT